MHWRVGCGCRHHLQHIIRGYLVRPTRSVLLPQAALCNHQLTFSRWLSALSPAIHDATYDKWSRTSASLTPHRTSVNHQTRASSNAAKGRSTRAEHIPLPPELLEVIDSALIWTITREMLSKKLEGVPGTLKVLNQLYGSQRNCKLAERMVSTTQPTRALRVLVLAHRLGCALEQQAFEAVAWNLAKDKLWDLIPPLVFLAKDLIHRSSVSLLNWHARSLVGLSEFALLDQVLNSFKEEGLRPDRRTFHTIASGHIRNNNLPAAMKALAQMQEDGHAIDATTQAAVAAAYRTLGPDVFVQSQALDALASADGRTSTLILNALMQLAIDAHDVDRLVSIVQLFDQDKLSVPRAFRNGGTSTVRDGSRPRPHSMQWASSHASSTKIVPPIHPDIVSYTILLNYMARRRDLASAILLMEQIQATSVRPDAPFAAALIRIYLAVDRPDTAVHIVSSMCGGDLTIVRLFSELSLNVSSEGIPSILDGELAPTTEIFNALLSGMLSIRGLDGMRVVLKIMLACNVPPDRYTLDIFISHLDRVEGLQSSEIARTLHRLLAVTSQPSLNHIQALLRVILRLERQQGKRSGWNSTPSPQLPNPRISPTEGPFDPIAGIQPLSHPSVTQPILESLKSRGVRANRATAALRIQHDAVTRTDMTAARDAFQIMLDRGLHPNEYHYGALMEGYVKAGDFAAARAVLDAAAKAGVKRNVVMYTILIAGYARLRQPDQAIRSLRDMVSLGVKPDGVVVSTVASAYFAVGAYKLARRVVVNLWPFIAPFPRDLREAPLKILVDRLRSLQSSHSKGQTTKMLTEREKDLIRRQLGRIAKDWRLLTDVQKEYKQAASNYLTTRPRSYGSHSKSNAS
ncbi:hypothetical protein EW146_g585 [Bondarzewia mesenterica]|uniref:Pentacotripeptide-repeat region of PRORP domain-containing protein n=1 Tax=Bondarzewia mesenterica TaxID=1095465 RepID=A0A4S4M6G1_9AGAM|nr:hypothetical protein EW146_g585 [Bondarzewia mesenterica]